MRVLWDGKETCHEEAHGSTRKTLMVECCCAFRDFPRDLLALGPKDHLKIRENAAEDHYLHESKKRTPASTQCPTGCPSCSGGGSSSADAGSFCLVTKPKAERDCDSPRTPSPIHKCASAPCTALVLPTTASPEASQSALSPHSASSSAVECEQLLAVQAHALQVPHEHITECRCRVTPQVTHHWVAFRSNCHSQPREQVQQESLLHGPFRKHAAVEAEPDSYHIVRMDKGSGVEHLSDDGILPSCAVTLCCSRTFWMPCLNLVGFRGGVLRNQLVVY
eukprot:1150012-Pelagomonas_calceolata.AAC.3